MTLAFGITSYGQTAVPTDDVTIQMNNNGPAQTDGNIHIQYAANSQGLNQSHNGLIKFNLSSLPAGLTAANIQSATLTLFVDAGGSPGTITVCQLASSPLWSGATVTGTTAPACSSVATVSFNVSSTQLQGGSFVVVNITPIVQSWVSGAVNNGLMLAADAPPSGMNPINVQLDAIQHDGNGFSPQIQVVLQNQGPQGPQGPVGLTGPQGPKGDTGATGAQGPVGLTGATGATGAAGPQGPQGVAGTDGVGFTFRQTYNPAATYVVNDVVSFNGSSYVSLVSNNVGQQPDTTPLAWSLIAQVGAKGDAGAVGPQGPVGPMGATGAAGAAGAQGPIGPTGPQGPKGDTGAAGAVGPQGPAGPTGATGAAGATGAPGPVGPTGPSGPSGPAGAPGAAGASTYAGIWSPTATYTQGQEVLRPAGIGSPGPFFAITAAPVVGSDPAIDTADWVYCCGTATIGYTPFNSSGSLPTSFTTSSSQSLASTTFNSDNSPRTFTVLSVSVSALAGSEACLDNGSPLCSSIDPGATANCIHVTGHNFTCPTTGAAMTVALSRNGMVVATGTINSDGSFTAPTFSAIFNPGDTLALKIMNPSGVVNNTVASGSWSLQ